MYKIFPPEITSTPDAPRLAADRLAKMGPMSRDERIMLGTMGGAVALWVCGDALGIAAVTTAMMGLCVLLGTGVLQWRECLGYPAAWDTLFWFAILVGMSGQLNALGVISHFAGGVGAQLAAANLGVPAVFLLLNAAYFGLHYMFASQASAPPLHATSTGAPAPASPSVPCRPSPCRSTRPCEPHPTPIQTVKSQTARTAPQTAHVGALYSAFLAMMLSTGVPGVVAALTLGFMSNLFGSITHYGSGQGAVYYGAGYLTLKEVFTYGGIMGAINFGIYMTLGVAWWKVLGLM
jgi:DASS family divalent anion:Na+ symporter